jgi:zinc carboxypeptidase
MKFPHLTALLALATSATTFAAAAAAPATPSATPPALTALVPAAAQEAGGQWKPQVEIAWNRYYKHAELQGHLNKLAQAYPDFVSSQEIGKSWEGRPMIVYTLANRKAGVPDLRPAMWVDGNVHGNEVQGGEAVVYLAWWLLEHYDTNPRAKWLLDHRTFYLLPSQNPDGRDHWFNAANTASSSRTGAKPTDNDRDGNFDEDDYDDLDGDGEITRMRKRVPMGEGTYRLNPDDPRLMERVRGDQQGNYLMLGSEGIDNDHDGRINEDGKGGYDMNRNWASDWQPGHIQYGAGDYPFSYPETAGIAKFLLAHPNVAAVQSFHNAGGMILRGPGDHDAAVYPRADLRAYDALGAEGERMLPFYRYMVIWEDLYTVHGGFVNWTYEGLGMFSFTNELWSRSQQYNRTNPTGLSELDPSMAFNDSVLLGDTYVDWHEYEHPLYGTIEIGGYKRQSGRVAPSFLIEEMIHRNAMFCARHAEEIAQVSLREPTVEDLGEGLYRVRITLENSALIPSRSAMAAENHIGTPDIVTFDGDNIEVLAGGTMPDRWRDERFQPVASEPHRLRLNNGVPGSSTGPGTLKLAWLVRGTGPYTIRYQAVQADDGEVKGSL